MRGSIPGAEASWALVGGDGNGLGMVIRARFQRGDRTPVEESLSEGSQPTTAANVATLVPTVIPALRPLGRSIPSFSVAPNWLTKERRTPIGAGMSVWRTVALLLGLTTAESAAEGLLLFNNLYPSGPGFERGWIIRTRFSFLQLDGPASGSNYLAQLLAGRSSENLVPVGPPVSFRTGVGAGYFDPAKDPTGLVRVVPTIDDKNGGETYVQVRAWCSVYGITTYEQLLEYNGCGGYTEWGLSPTVLLDTAAADGSESPKVMDGFGAFWIVGPLSGPWDSFYVPRQTNDLLRAIFKANIHDYPGKHVLEMSTNLLEWYSGETYTNASTLEIFMTNDRPAQFYRMRRLCE